MDKHLDIRLSDAPYKTFQPLHTLPAYCKRAIPQAVDSHLLHDQIQIINQELPGWKSHASCYTFMAEGFVPIHLRVTLPMTFFFQPLTPGMTFRHPLYKPFSLAINQVMALHLPVGSYHSILKPGIHELCIIGMPYGLLVQQSQSHPYLKRICKHWKQHLHHLQLYRLGTVRQLLMEVPADFQQEPEKIFDHFNPYSL